MTSSEQKEILSEISTSNFDEAMYLRNSWRTIGDYEFHKLLKAYGDAREVLADYIGWED